MDEMTAKASKPVALQAQMPLRRIFSIIGKTIDQASNIGAGISASLILIMAFIIRIRLLPGSIKIMILHIRVPGLISSMAQLSLAAAWPRWM